MTNLEKMNELVGTNASKKEIVTWAYMNRIALIDLPCEKEFANMDKSVEAFHKTNDWFNDSEGERKNWEKFLESKFVG